MEISDETRAALDRWTRAGTWDTQHPSDTGRFFDFASSYLADNEGKFDESELRDMISSAVRKWHEDAPNDAMISVIKARVRQLATIGEYVRHVNYR